MKNLSRIICMILTLMLLLAAVPLSASAKETKVQADGFNSVRGGGQLIVYTPDFGPSTKTNNWGYEVVIENDVAVEFFVGDANIPSNGFVLSGHDMAEEGGKNMGTWIKENISLGDYVYVNDAGTVTVSDKPIEPELFYSITKKYNGSDCVRDADFLVIYTQKFGATTQTNDWGYEVVVTEGVVTSIGGNNNAIPKGAGSIVISGHGASSEWIKENVVLGMKVSYVASKQELTLTYDEDSAKYGTQLTIDAVKQEYAKAQAEYRLIDFDAALASINALETALNDASAKLKKDKNANAFAKSCQQINEDSKQTLLLLSESRPVEYRGVWIRPEGQKNKEDVEEYVDELKKNGINMISVETLYACTMIMPMPEGSLFEQNPSLKGFDLLQAYIDACHARDMELHIWLPIFYVADGGHSYYTRSVAFKKPEWLSKPSTGGSMPADTEGYAMLNPYNKEVQEFLLGTYEYILKNYDIDGFQLDYIRFYSRTAEMDLGYNQDLLQAFADKYGVTPTYNTYAPYWKDWVQFRCDVITDFVARIRKLVDTVAPDVLLSADVVPEPNEAKQSNYQDYMTWLEKGYIDLLHPMAYGYGFEDEIEEQVENCGNNTFIAPGLGIFMAELTPNDMQDQVSDNISLRTDGSVFFESGKYLSKNTGALLKNGAYRDTALPPALYPERTVATMLDYAKKRINDIIVPQGAITGDANAILSAIDALKGTASDCSIGSSEYNALVSLINSTEMDKNARDVILADIEYAIKVCRVYDKELDLSDVPDFSSPDSESDDVTQDVSAPAESNPSDEQTGDDSKPSNIVPIICISVSVAAIIALIIFIILNKKKK